MSFPDIRAIPLLILGFFTSSGVIYLVAESLGPITAAKGLYLPAGILLSMILCLKTQYTEERRKSSITVRRLGKVAYSLSFVSIAVTLVTTTRIYVLLLIFPVIVTALVLQLRQNPSSRWVLPQLCLVSAIPPLTKYLSVGFYFGNGDIFSHVERTRQLLAAGSAAGIQDTYSLFPGLHLFVGSGGLLTGLSVYDAILLLGIITFAGLPLIVFQFGQLVFTRTQIALATSFSVLGLSLITYSATYFFPQSFATVLLFFVAYLTFRADSTGTRLGRVFTALGFIVLFTLVFTHHFSFVLLAPVPLLFGAFALAVRAREHLQELEPVSELEPRLFVLVGGGMAALTYWLYYWPGFIRYGLITKAFKVFGASVFTGDTTRAGGVDTTPISPTGVSTLENLANFYLSGSGIYMIALVAVIGLGAVRLFESRGRYHRTWPLVLTSLFVTPLILKVPLGIKALRRFRTVLSFFAVFVVGLGVFHLIRARSGRRVMNVLTIGLLVVLVSTSALVAADDIDLFEPNVGQKSLSKAEWSSHQVAADHLRQFGASTSSFWASRNSVELEGAHVTNPETVTRHTIQISTDTFLYSTNWAERPIPYITNTDSVYIRHVWFTDAGLQTMVIRNNQIYDSGSLGLLSANNNTITRTRK